jgi:hypothetical protein
MGETPGHTPPETIGDEQKDSLRLEVQAVSPEQKRRCEEVERAVADAFIFLFGKYLREDQIAQLRKPDVIIPEPGSIGRLSDLWRSKGKENCSPGELSDLNLNGKVYVEYRSTLPADPKGQDGSVGRMITPGDIPLAPLPGEGEIDIKWLCSESDFKKSSKMILGDDYSTEYENADSFWATNEWAVSALHEKLHSVMDPNLPYPIEECAVRYYVYKVFNKMKWYGSREWEQATKDTSYSVYADLRPAYQWMNVVDNLGADTHRLVFDSIQDDDKRKKLLDKAKKNFTEEDISRAFPDTVWETEPVEDF